MPSSHSFPAVQGGCNCGLIRYQLDAPPLFCYACHCSECQKSSGSIFAASATVEFDRIKNISSKSPHLVEIVTHRTVRTIARCPDCQCVLWDIGSWRPSTVNVHVGTLDLPGLFEPDLHIYVEGKVQWLTLPEGTRTVRGDMDKEVWWPKASLERFEACCRRWEEREKKRVENEEKRREDEGNDEAAEHGDKTPTNGSPGVENVRGKKFEEQEEDEEDDDPDEEAQRRQDALERELEERLMRLSLKLDQEESRGTETRP